MKTIGLSESVWAELKDIRDTLNDFLVAFGFRKTAYSDVIRMCYNIKKGKVKFASKPAKEKVVTITINRNAVRVISSVKKEYEDAMMVGMSYSHAVKSIISDSKEKIRKDLSTFMQSIDQMDKDDPNTKRLILKKLEEFGG